jgi:DNA-binding response OmpR family regulator
MKQQKRVLAVEDCPIASRLIEESVGSFFDLSIVDNYQKLQDELPRFNPDLILLDVNLPGEQTGFQICKELQQHPSFSKVPVIFVTGRGEVNDRIMGYKVGGDDYIAKPFDPIELLTRIEARLKKYSSTKRMMIKLGNLVINPSTHQVILEENNERKNLILTNVEYKILLYFANHPDQIVSRAKLLDALGGNNLNVSDRSIDAHVCHLRKKLTGASYQFRSIYGVGYKFSEKSE